MTRDLHKVKCIKIDGNRVLVMEKDIKNRWKKYFYDLFNEWYEILLDANKTDIGGEYQNYNLYYLIKKHDVKEAFKRLSSGNVVMVGPNNLPIKLWKNLWDIEWLTEFFNKIMRSRKMSNN